MLEPEYIIEYYKTGGLGYALSMILTMEMELPWLSLLGRELQLVLPRRFRSLDDRSWLQSQRSDNGIGANSV